LSLKVQQNSKLKTSDLLYLFALTWSTDMPISILILRLFPPRRV